MLKKMPLFLQKAMGGVRGQVSREKHFEKNATSLVIPGENNDVDRHAPSHEDPRSRKQKDKLVPKAQTRKPHGQATYKKGRCGKGEDGEKTRPNVDTCTVETERSETIGERVGCFPKRDARKKGKKIKFERPRETEKGTDS